MYYFEITTNFYNIKFNIYKYILHFFLYSYTYNFIKVRTHVSNLKFLKIYIYIIIQFIWSNTMIPYHYQYSFFL